MYFLPVDRIRALDQEAQLQGIPGAVLMENAGYAAFCFLRKIFAPQASRFLVLGGCGNNGGDAWVVARYIIQEGLKCDPVLLGDTAKLKGDALLQYRRLERLGVRIHSVKTPEGISDYLNFWRGDVIVDGMCGSGFKGGANALLASAITAVNRSRAKVFALDIPSGLPSDGEEARLCVKADWTVSFAQGKQVFLTEQSYCCGRTEIVDIGCPEVKNPSSAARALSLREALALLPKPAENGHKYKRGHLLVLAGSEGMGGAAVLCAESAAQVSGMVTAAVPASLVPVLNARAPHILTVGLTGDIEKDLEALAAPLEKAGALAVGCGFPDDEYHSSLLKAAYECDKPQVWDAGALSLLAGDALSFPFKDKNIILTPHEGEFQRLMGEASPKDDPGRLEAAAKAAEYYETPFLLKGRHTVVCAPGSLPYVNLSGNAYLAAAGAGDVLTGLIGAFLAQSLEPQDAGALAAYFHGLSADILAARGPFSASQLISALPSAFKFSGI